MSTSSPQLNVQLELLKLLIEPRLAVRRDNLACPLTHPTQKPQSANSLINPTSSPSTTHLAQFPELKRTTSRGSVSERAEGDEERGHACLLAMDMVERE